MTPMKTPQPASVVRRPTITSDPDDEARVESALLLIRV
jgi:hypothetical protein